MRERRVLQVERQVHEDPRAVVFRLDGKLTGTKDSYEFLEDVRDEIHAGQPCLILNLGQVSRITSPGVGILAACFTSVKNAGGRLCIVETPDAARTLLEVVCLWQMIEHYDSEEEALKAACS